MINKPEINISGVYIPDRPDFAIFRERMHNEQHRMFCNTVFMQDSVQIRPMESYLKRKLNLSGRNGLSKTLTPNPVTDDQKDYISQLAKACMQGTKGLYTSRWKERAWAMINSVRYTSEPLALVFVSSVSRSNMLCMSLTNTLTMYLPQ